MRWIMAATLSFAFVSAFATGTKGKQVENPAPVRFRIRHADPWHVKAMLEGLGGTSPEVSTIQALLGGGKQGNQNQQPNSPLLKDGYLVVNPTDNSLWWYPKRAGDK